jgi:hypothetical protein
MHTVIRMYRLDDGDMDEALHRADTAMADAIAAEPGFIAYEIVRTGADTITSMTTFRDEAGCERSNELAAAFVRDELGDMTITKVGSESGPVAVSRAAREVLEPAHA